MKDRSSGRESSLHRYDLLVRRACNSGIAARNAVPFSSAGTKRKRPGLNESRDASVETPSESYSRPRYALGPGRGNGPIGANLSGMGWDFDSAAQFLGGNFRVAANHSPGIIKLVSWRSEEHRLSCCDSCGIDAPNAKLLELGMQSVHTQATIYPASGRDERELREALFAMRLSLVVGLAMLVGKTTVYLITHSTAIFADAAESVVHVIAVGFAWFSLRLSTKSASPQFLYGYERITFFSAGFEGAMIVVAAIAILYESIRRWMAGLQLEHLGAGTGLILIAGTLNAGLGYYLLRVGRRTNSLILEADGKHVLTDSWTSFGVVGGLGLVLLTHWKPFDPLVAIAVAVNILRSGGRLVWHSAVGLMDYSDPEAGRKIREKLDTICSELAIQYHGVRFRTTGYRQIIEVHLLFPRLTSVSEAHRLATILEERLAAELGMPAEVATHLESLEDHADVHHEQHYTGKPE
jgi:cation diffusion facilitator family transporter